MPVNPIGGSTFAGGRVSRSVRDLYERLRTVKHLSNLDIVGSDGIAHDEVMDVAMSVIIVGVKGSGDDTTVRERRAYGLTDPRANFRVGHLRPNPNPRRKVSMICVAALVDVFSPMTAFEL